MNVEKDLGRIAQALIEIQPFFSELGSEEKMLVLRAKQLIWEFQVWEKRKHGGDEKWKA